MYNGSWISKDSYTEKEPKKKAIVCKSDAEDFSGSDYEEVIFEYNRSDSSVWKPIIQVIWRNWWHLVNAVK